MKLTPRLQTIANYVQKNSIVADIGTDHGYIPVYLITNGICDKVIAADINQGPLNSAKNYIQKKGLTDKIDIRLGDGLKVLKPNEVNTAIIAGMGGLLINNILKESSNIAKTIDSFILQPMIAVEDLRRFLINNHFKIMDETLAKEGNKIYEIMYVEHGEGYVENDIYYEVGKKLIENKDPLLEEFLNKKLTKIEKIIKSLEKSQATEGRKKCQLLKDKHCKIMEVIRQL